MGVKVYIIESEAGWGQRTEDVLEFDTHEEAEQYTRTYNSKHNPPSNTTPEWYMYAHLEGQGFGMLRLEND